MESASPLSLIFFCPDMPSFARMFDHPSLEVLRDDVRKALEHLPVTDFSLSYKIGANHEFILKTDGQFRAFEIKSRTASRISIYIRLTNAAGAPAAGHQRPNSQSSLVVRTRLLEYLYETGLNLHYFLIKGTPGSGKLTLCNQLFDYIRIRDPDARVTMLDVWRDGETLEDRMEASYIRGSREVNIDPTFWSEFVKSAPGKNFILIFFASFWSTPRQAVDVLGTPNMFRLHERMGLHPTEHGLGDSPHIPGLFFLEAEYDELVMRQQEYNELPVLAQDLKRWVFNVSAGHVGVMRSIFDAIKDKAKGLRLPQIGLSAFMASFSDPNKAIEVCSRGRAFARGLPGYRDLNRGGHISAALEFCLDLVGATIPLELDPKAIPHHAMEAYKLGWITMDEKRLTQGIFISVNFPSSFHHCRIWSLLCGREPLHSQVKAMAEELLVQVIPHPQLASAPNASPRMC
ncbi:hypothetical protein MSAN_00188700 [Mycena sanguinolenta]|uniref:Uncharacterized protein n=1 Tax=Mycena sanguinolenta TaxID=230812 RepID=A0A8H6ZEQ9_9AGAR|nr:hypothetical protein MSAN_00188700 [Mycena sanguinolenta]